MYVTYTVELLVRVSDFSGEAVLRSVGAPLVVRKYYYQVL